MEHGKDLACVSIVVKSFEVEYILWFRLSHWGTHGTQLLILILVCVSKEGVHTVHTVHEHNPCMEHGKDLACVSIVVKSFEVEYIFWFRLSQWGTHSTRLLIWILICVSE